MKLFRIDLSDSDGSVMTEKLVVDHVDFLTKLHHDGVLMFCGPCYAKSSAMILLKANSKQEADDIIAQDPFSLKRFYRLRVINEIAECNIENQFLLDASIEFIRAKDKNEANISH